MPSANQSAPILSKKLLGTVELTSYAKNRPKTLFLKIALDRFLVFVYFWDNSVFTLPQFGQDLTEREEADLRHDDISQDGTMPRRPGLAICLFARL